MKKFFFSLLFLISSQLFARNEIKIESMYPGIYKISLGETDAHTPFSVCESKPNAQSLKLLENCKEYVRPEDIRIDCNKRGCLVEIPLKEEEQIYGFGLQSGSFMQKGLRKQPIVNDHPLNDLGYTHAPQTFYVSNKGYGVVVNTYRYTTFYAGTLQSKGKVKDTTAGNRVAETTEELYRTESSGNNMQVDIPGASGIEVILICGADLKEVLQKYNLLGGGGALPPMWGLGVKYRMKGDSEAEDVKRWPPILERNKYPAMYWAWNPVGRPKSIPVPTFGKRKDFRIPNQ